MDLYELLGVTKIATQDEIKQAYKRAVQKHHPDKNGDEKVFKEIQLAYDTLKDKDKREHYDQTGETDNKPTIDLIQEKLIALFLNLVNDSDYSGDFVEKAHNLLRTEKEKLNRMGDQLAASIVNVEVIKDRVKTTDETNLFVQVVESKLASLNDDLSFVNIQLDHYDLIFERLMKYNDNCPEEMLDVTISFDGIGVPPFSYYTKG